MMERCVAKSNWFGSSSSIMENILFCAYSLYYTSI
jgi:hypothetical protein